MARARDGIWYVDVKPRGYPYRITRSTDQRVRDTALAYEATLRRLAAAGRHDLLDAVRDGRYTCQEVYAADLAGRLHELRPGERSLEASAADYLQQNPGYQYRAAVRRVLGIAPAAARTGWLTDPKHIGRLVVSMRRRGLADGTIRRDLMVVSKWIAYEFGPAQRTETMARVDRPAGAVRDRWLTDTEIAALREHAGPDLWPLIAVSLATGLRKSELLRLEIAHIDFAGGQLLVHRGKTRSARRRVPVPGAVLVLLRGEIARQGRRQGLLWPEWSVDRLRRAWEVCRREAGLEGVRWHDLRRTFGVNCARAGVPLNELQKYMGHGSVNVTIGVYGDYAPDGSRPELDAAMRSMGLGEHDPASKIRVVQ